MLKSLTLAACALPFLRSRRRTLTRADAAIFGPCAGPCGPTSADCTKPYQRCLKTGTFITPLGRVFKANSR